MPCNDGHISGQNWGGDGCNRRLHHSRNCHIELLSKVETVQFMLSLSCAAGHILVANDGKCNFGPHEMVQTSYVTHIFG